MVRLGANMATPGELTIAVLERANGLILQLAGRIRHRQRCVLERTIADAAVSAGGVLVLDLDRLEFIESSGLRVLLGAADDAQERGQRFAVTPGSAQVQRLLEITGASTRLPSITQADEVPT